jgi:hypothetical protein
MTEQLTSMMLPAKSESGAKQYKPFDLLEEIGLEAGPVLRAEGSEASDQQVVLEPWKQIPNR